MPPRVTDVVDKITPDVRLIWDLLEENIASRRAK